MKQILSSLMVLTLAVPSLSGTVVACDNSRKTATTNEDYANRIRDKITQPNVTVNSIGNKLESNVPVSKYTQAITNTLKSDNTQLATAITAATNAGQKVSFNYSGVVSTNETATINAQIQVGTYQTNPFALKVTLAPNDAQKVQMLRNKITNTTQVTVQENTDTTIANNTAGIKTALRSLNPSLTTADLNDITFGNESGNLTLGTPVQVTGTIKINDQETTFTFNVTLANTNQQKAKAIQEKIVTNSLTLPAQNDNKTISQVTAQIKAALKTANPTLTTTDLNKMSFPSTRKLTSFSNNQFIATITEGSAKALITLNVKINNTWKAVDANALRNTTGAGAVTKFPNQTGGGSTYYWATGQGLFTSSDGLNWSKDTKLPSNFGSYSSVVQIDDVYYLSSYNLGLFRSTDGKTWNNVIPSTSASIFFSAPFKPSDSSPIYAASESKGLWYSIDNGETWTQVNASGTATSNLPSDVKLRKPFVKIGDTYYLTTMNHGLWKTDDITDGGTWTQVTGGLSSTLGIWSQVTQIGSTYYLDSLNNGLYTSDDGTTWTHNTDIPNNMQSFWAVKKIDTTYYMATDAGGLWTSQDGTNWSRLGNSFFEDRNIVGFRKPPVVINGTYYIGSKEEGLWSSLDGKNWVPTNLTRGGTQSYGTYRVYSNPNEINDTLYLPTLGQGLWSLK